MSEYHWFVVAKIYFSGDKERTTTGGIVTYFNVTDVETLDRFIKIASDHIREVTKCQDVAITDFKLLNP